MDYKNEMIEGVDKLTISFKSELKVTAEEAVEYLKKVSCEIDNNSPLHYNRIKISDDIDLWIPGKYSNCLGDYQMTWKRKPPKHLDVCDALIEVAQDYGDFSYWINLLVDVYENGTINMDINENEREKKIKQVLFWVTLQEDINHASNQGRKIPFCRYAEAIALTVNDTQYYYDELVERVNSPNQEMLEEWELPIKPKFYNWRAF